mmetsp:Transcript_11377/g.24980  ORF Transcript_11377/g.24980 Transcript_11377/m.24980 type:complete len:144 (+) Transcript_11377:247-678(+)
MHILKNQMQCFSRRWQTTLLHWIIGRDSNLRQYPTYCGHLRRLKYRIRGFSRWWLITLSHLIEAQAHLFEKKVADHVVALDNLHAFDSQNCSNIVSAFATANIIHHRLFRKVAAHVDAHIDFTSLDGTSQINSLQAFEKSIDG